MTREEDTEAAVDFIINGKIGDDPPKHEKRVGKPLQEFDGVVPPQLPKLKTHDEFGLSLDPKHWAKSKCDTCYGKGVYLVIYNIPASSVVKGVTGDGNVTKMTEPCYCALRAYQKIRLPLQDRVLKIWERLPVSEEEKVKIVQALVEETLKQVRNTGTAIDVKTMVRAANEAANQRLAKPTGSDVRRVLKSRR